MAAKKGSIASLQKAESITVRLNPRMKYGLELLARKHHRSVSSVVEWAIGLAIEDPDAGLWREESRGLKLEKGQLLLEEVWDPYPADRLIKLAIFQPELLAYEEDVLWKFIQNESNLWVRAYTYLVAHSKENVGTGSNLKKEIWQFVEEEFKFKLLRSCWLECVQFMASAITESELSLVIYREVSNEGIPF